MSIALKTAAEIDELIARGYRRVSRAHGRVARVDRPDWLKFMASEGYRGAFDRAGDLADCYRRVYSKDVVELNRQDILKVPPSGWDETAFVIPPGEAVACRICAGETLSEGTGLCDGCWELESRIHAAPELARKILGDLSVKTGSS